MMITKKQILMTITVIVVLVFGSVFNPFSYNDAGERTVVERVDGSQFIQYSPGVFYAGFFAKEKSYPNQISVSYQADQPDLEVKDGTIEIGKIKVRFGGDATTADVSGIVQYILPMDEKEMIEMHNAHRTLESLVSKRIAPYTKECLQSSAQLMSSEMHYSGGRASMAQDFSDQLKNGVFILKTTDKVIFDSLERENKRVYETKPLEDKNGNIKRKFSSIKEYGITVADAAITDVDYEERVDKMLAKKIDASTKASVSKQELLTAQQQQLTAKAKGEQALVEIEYRQKQEQTKQVVAAQTKVEVAKQDMEQQRIQAAAAELEAKKIKTLADAEAYAKQRVMSADGALDKKLAAYKEVQRYWAEALKGYQGNITPSIVTGGGNAGNGATNFMEMMGAKAARDLSLDLKNK
jgi:regulator of protease activity HflC (stomatin/prohibitin superfamily)